jgi:hypothetical protein
MVEVRGSARCVAEAQMCHWTLNYGAEPREELLIYVNGREHVFSARLFRERFFLVNIKN